MATKEEKLARLRFLELKRKSLGGRQPDPSLIPEPISRIGQQIETGVARLPEPIRQPAQVGLTTAQAALKGIAGAAVPGGATTIEQPELAGRTALGILAPLRSLGGLTLKGIAKTGLGRRAIGKTQERLAGITPTTVPGLLQKEVARRATPQQFQQLGETLAEVGGFLGTGRLVKGTPLDKDIFSLGKKLSNIKLFQSDEALTDVAKQGKQIIGRIEKDLSKEISNTFKSGIGNKKLSTEGIEQVNRAFEKLPKKVFSKLKTDIKTFDIEFEKGTLKNSARNIWRTRKFLDNFLKSKDFTDFGPGSIEQGRILSARRALAGVLRGIDPKIEQVMKAFSEFEIKAKTLRPLFTKTQADPTPVFNKLRALFSSKGEPGVRVVFDQIKELNNIKDFVKAFNKGQLLKKIGLGLAGTLATGAFLRRGRQVVEGESELGPGPQ